MMTYTSFVRTTFEDNMQYTIVIFFYMAVLNITNHNNNEEKIVNIENLLAYTHMHAHTPEIPQREREKERERGRNGIAIIIQSIGNLIGSCLKIKSPIHC